MTSAAKIRVTGLRKSFGPKRVLDGLEFELPAGQSLAIIGASGSGKSVTLKCILGLLAVDAGLVEIDGRDVTALPGRERERLLGRFGMLFQGAALFDSLPVWQNVAFALMQGHGVGRRQARRIAIDKLAAVGLAPAVADLWPAELSGGMQKRVGLARAIAAEPEVIFFDEPTTGLDPIMSDVINVLIQRIVRDTGATALSITHDMASARKIADRVAMLHGGRIIWTGAPAELDRSGNDFVDQFVHGRAEGPIQMQVGAG